MVGITPTVPHAISVGTFFALFLLCFGLHEYLRQRARSRQLVDKLRGPRHESEILGLERDPSTALGRLRNGLVGTLSRVGQRVGPKETTLQYSRMRTRFLRAGLRRASYPALFWGAKFMLMAGLSMGFFLARAAGVVTFEKTNSVLVIALFIATSGFYLPDVWLHLHITKRKRSIFEGIPDALDLLVVCVEAGMGLDAAMNRIAEEMEFSNPELSDELRIYNLEMRAGKPRQEALNHLATRIDLDDFSSLVTLLIQTDKFGTSLAQALRIYSDTFRLKRYIRAEELAAKLPTLLMIPLILFIFPALFVVILGPAAIRMYHMIHGSL